MSRKQTEQKTHVPSTNQASNEQPISEEAQAKPRKRFQLFKKKKAVPQEPEPFLTASQVAQMISIAQSQTAKTQRGIDPFVIGFTLGMTAGGVVAGMLTPQSSKKARQHLHEQGLAVKSQAENIALQAKTTAQQVLKQD